MSWLYRLIKKSDDESTITIPAGSLTLTSGNLTLSSGNATITGNQLVSGTARVSTSPLYLGSGTVGVAWGTAIDPWKGQSVTIPSLDKGSLYIQTTYGTVYTKIGYATTAWATVTVATS